MSNPHANHQGEPGDTGTGDEVERLAEIMWQAASRSGESIVVSQRALCVMARAVIASAPSPDPAGAGGDLASAIAAEIMGLGWALPDFRGDEEEAEEECDRRHGQVQHAVEAVLARSGKLVASTGSEEETKGDHRELRAVMRRLSAAKNAGDIEDPETQAQVLGHAVDACIGRIREYLATVAPTPEATPKSSPDQTPVDPQMTVKAARFFSGDYLRRELEIESAQSLIDSLNDGIPDKDHITPEQWVLAYRWTSDGWKGSVRQTFLARADAIEAALRTLQAAGEAR